MSSASAAVRAPNAVACPIPHPLSRIVIAAALAMRIRLDAQGRPRPPVPPPPTASPPPQPLLQPSTPSTTAPNPPVARPPPAHPAPPLRPLSAAEPPPLPDDERGSDSGASVATEGYNSEDEHPHAQIDLPARTQREREVAFVAQQAARGLRVVEMRPDGNCLFRALAHAVWNDAEKHASLRAAIMQYLLQERDYFSQFVAEDFVRYVRRKKRDGTHGNHLELQAAAELFGRPIEVYAYSSTPATVVEAWGAAAGAAADASSTREPIRLSFHRGSHYNALEPFNAPDKSAKRAAAEAAEYAAVRAAADARVTEEEIERAVLALSLVEASREDHGAGSASSSAAAVPSTVLALVNAGYSEESASDAYRVAGHGGLSEMVRYLTSDRFQSKRLSSVPQRRPRSNKYENLPISSAPLAAEIRNESELDCSFERSLTIDTEAEDLKTQGSEEGAS